MSEIRYQEGDLSPAAVAWRVRNRRGVFAPVDSAEFALAAADAVERAGMDAHARMLHAADSARTARDQSSRRIMFDVERFSPAELAAYYHGKQDAYEHAAQMTRQDRDTAPIDLDEVHTALVARFSTDPRTSPSRLARLAVEVVRRALVTA